MKQILSKSKAPIYFLILVFLSTLAFISCGDNGDTDTDENTFDRGAMLEALADDLIIPNFERLQVSVGQMATASEDFIQNPTEEGLEALRNAWKQAVIDHQHCSAFGFGPGQLLLGDYASVLGVFPVSESKIEANILNPDFDLANSFDRDIRGFYGVEYLIFGNGKSDTELIAGFDDDRIAYLSLLVNELKSTFDTIVMEWNSSYRQTFISNDGTSAGSPISLFYNSFVRDYENLKNFKIELPAGLTADQDHADGTLVEAFYSGISSDLIREHFDNCKNIWFGLSRNGTEGIGFEEYLNTVVGGPELVDQTIMAITSIDNAIDALPEGRLSENVSAIELVALRDALQANTANFKSSIVSLLGLTITFNSGDGD
jgi:hypothetical protein